MAEIKIDKKQAHKIALTIFADIERYVKEHEQEFTEFCEEENHKERSTYDKK